MSRFFNSSPSSETLQQRRARDPDAALPSRQSSYSTLDRPSPGVASPRVRGSSVTRGRWVSPEPTRTNLFLGVSPEQASVSNSCTQMRPPGSNVHDNAPASRRSSNSPFFPHTSQPAYPFGSPAEGMSKASSRRFMGAVSPVGSDEGIPASVTAPRLAGGTSMDKRTATIKLLQKRMDSLLREARKKMNSKTYEGLFDQMLSRRIGWPREVQMKAEEDRLRTNVETLRDSIMQFDINSKIAGTGNAAEQSEKKQMPANSTTSLPKDTVSADNDDEQSGTLDSLAQMTQVLEKKVRQDSMESMARDLSVLADGFVESKMETMPILLKQIVDDLGSMHATNKELVELFNQKAPAQSPFLASAKTPFITLAPNPGSKPPIEHGIGSQTDETNGRDPFRFAPASGASAVGRPRFTKDDQIATLKDQLQNSQSEHDFWKQLHQNTEQGLRKRLEE
ncbi:hypothetical protein PMIN02_005009 [Paraphaeosphaeria minitans]